jgi:hypothetical protein
MRFVCFFFEVFSSFFFLPFLSLLLGSWARCRRCEIPEFGSAIHQIEALAQDYIDGLVRDAVVKLVMVHCTA